jgi:flagellar biosynthesis regulator FlaF
MAEPTRSLRAIKIVTDDVAEASERLRIAGEHLDAAAHLLERATYTSRGLGYDETATRLEQKQQAWTTVAGNARQEAQQLQGELDRLRPRSLSAT